MSDPKCPYCGTAMMDDSYTWQCPKCHSSSPVVIYEEKCQSMTEEEKKTYAREAAMRRPMQKPLTLEELGALGRAKVWEERREPHRLMKTTAASIYIVAQSSKIDKDIAEMFGYNSEIRAWITIPSEKEMEAAKWENG